MTNNDIDNEPVLPSRSGNSDVFGKLDDEIPAIRIDNETILRLHKEAHECGMNVTEFCRTVLRGRVWGSEHIETVNAERIRRAIGNAGTLRGNGVAT